MKHHLPLTTSAAALILTIAAAHADSTGFQGFYAPDTWTITGDGIGGSSAIFAADGSELTLTGSDGGFGSTVKATHAVLADGIWSFQWTWVGLDKSGGYDTGYYSINGVKYFLDSDGGGRPTTGSISVPVTAGQTVGWQVVSVDGIFGPGILTITDFRAPVPSPATLALLSLAAVTRARRRR